MTFVVGVDPSPGSRAALGVAAELAARFGEPLVIVTGVAPPGGPGEEYRAHADAVEQLSRSATGDALERARAAGADARVEVVRARASDALIEAGERHDARMLVVGASGEGPLRAAILGGTSYRVLHQATRPVLVVPESSTDHGADPKT